MYFLKVLKVHYIFGLIVLCSLVVNRGEAWLYDTSNDEILVYKYYQYKNELKWTWSVGAYCRFECRRRQLVVPKHTYVETRELLLEAVDCVKIEVEVFNCACELRRPGRYVKMFFGRDYYLSGLNGEIYDLGRANNTCGDSDTLRIFERKKGSEDTSLAVTQLRGITRLSLAMHTERVAARQWIQHRVAGKIPNSSSFSDEKW